MMPAATGDRLRLAVGVLCLAVAAVLFVTKVPHTYSRESNAVRANSYITSPLDRLLTTGDTLNISRGLQAGHEVRPVERGPRTLGQPRDAPAAPALTDRRPMGSG